VITSNAMFYSECRVGNGNMPDWGRWRTEVRRRHCMRVGLAAYGMWIGMALANDSPKDAVRSCANVPAD